MRMARTSRALVAGLVALVTASAATGAGAAEEPVPVIVGPGQSIQEALDEAGAGGEVIVRPGTYREDVAITEDGVSLIGIGATLEPPEQRNPDNPCANPEDPESVDGICIRGELDRETGEVVEPVHGASVIGFTVRGFPGSGVIAFGAHDALVQYVDAQDNDEYGITAFASSGTRFLNNRASGSEEAGFYIGDSPEANATLKGNVATGNGLFGYFMRDASYGTLEENQATGNCIGVGLLDSGSPGDVFRWTLHRNAFVANDAACPGFAEEGFPPVSGIGIMLGGALQTTIHETLVLDNVPSGPSAFAGGVALVDTTPFGGGTPRGNVVTGNIITGNQPADIVDDGSGERNRLTGNLCGTSQPAGLCGPA
jgi:parallel beta-helix repeat protein